MRTTPGLLLLAALPGLIRAQTPTTRNAPVASQQSLEWYAYAHDEAGTKFSPAAQITRENVNQLIPIWTYRTGDFARGDATARDETTPLFVDGVLYASTPFGGVRALNAETGEEIWSFDSEIDLSGHYGDFTNRGVSTWVDARLSRSAQCRRRIFVATVDARLIALDAKTGKPCTDFGSAGTVDLTNGLRNSPNYKGEYGVTSPPAIVRDLVIVGSSVGDNNRAAAPAGVVRAFDARTGQQRWSWDPIPRDSTQPGFDTWRGPSAHQTGAANAWAPISYDPKSDLLFVPTGSASPDFYGGERLGDNRYANSVVALRAATGTVRWAFQVVHHDLWDYDVPAEPVLFTFQRDSIGIPAVLATTKMGYVYILNRETGKPLFPVVERAVPRSDVPGEVASPTQPVPTLPAPLGPTKFSSDNVFAVSDASRKWCRDELAGTRSEGIFTPPSLNGTVIFPGNIGGSNWSGVALDPVHRLAIIPSNRLITLVQLVPRAAMHGQMGGTRFDENSPQTGTPYAMSRRHLLAPDGVPCNPPPWGVLTAIDLSTGKQRWERPFGGVSAGKAFPGSDSLGSPNLGGAMVTGGGLVFAGGALDQRLHAHDVETGRELWSAQLPAGVHASPMTYVTASGKQFVVVGAGGHREIHDKVGDYIVAFALPSIASPVPTTTEIASGDYSGHIILDRTRLRVHFHLTRSDSAAEVSFETDNPHVEGKGSGKIAGGVLASDLNWTFAAQHCGGTMQIRGSSANSGAAIIGELDYFDGCAGQRTKPGTFAVWKTAR